MIPRRTEGRTAACGTIGSMLRVVMRYAGHPDGGIPVPRMSLLRTNPMLAALPGQPGNRRISAGFIVEAATGASALRPRRYTLRSTAP